MLGNAGALELATAVAQQGRVQSLELSRNKITEQGCCEVMTALKAAMQLRWLDLSANVGDSAAGGTCSEVADGGRSVEGETVAGREGTVGLAARAAAEAMVLYRVDVQKTMPVSPVNCGGAVTVRPWWWWPEPQGGRESEGLQATTVVVRGATAVRLHSHQSTLTVTL